MLYRLKLLYYLINYKIVYINKKPQYLNNEDGFGDDERGYYMRKRTWVWVLFFPVSILWKCFIGFFLLIWRQYVEINTYYAHRIKPEKVNKNAKLTFKTYVFYMTILMKNTY